MNWDKLLNNNRLRPSERGDISDPARNDFESDFGRIIFSPALRRLHDKAQVFPLTTDDNIHSRLTHSMEAMSVGYSIGVKICEKEIFQQKLEKDKYELFREIPIIIKNCCLVHDIGNPPFGHFGETIIQNYFENYFNDNKVKQIGFTEEQKKDFLYFDGNAQGLRVLTKLQILNDKYGLNLTYATLASYLKYPHCGTPDKTRIETKKHGVFYSEEKYFQQIADKCELKIQQNSKEVILRHPLSYIVEAADSICYLVMDIEDAYNKKLVSENDLYDALKDFASIKDKVQEIHEDKSEKYKNDNTKVANYRIKIIQILVDLAVKNFIENIDKIEKGEYNQELIFDDKEKIFDSKKNKELNLAEKLQKICQEKIFTYRDICSLEVTGYSVINGLLDYYIKFIFHTDKKYQNRAAALISKSIIKAALEEKGIDSNDNTKGIEDLDPYYKLKVIVDFISGMTDQFALDHYQKISGQKIT